MIEKMNKDLEEFMVERAKASKSKEKKKDEDEMDFDTFLATHPAFMKTENGAALTQDQIDANPLLKSLQQIKYDDEEDSPRDRALAHKEDGNFHFQKKMYEKACKAYSEAIKQNCLDKELTAVLYTNRAAANFYRRNYRSSLLDSMAALEIQPNRVKSLTRCAQCCQLLKQYDCAIEWSNYILKYEKDSKFAKDTIAECQKLKKMQERDERKRKAEKRKQDAKTGELMNAIKARNVKLDDLSVRRKDEYDDPDPTDELELFKKLITSPTGRQVYLEDNALFWPILFIYPEYKTSDLIEGAKETTTLQDHLENVFAAKAHWDENYDYRVKNIEVFIENYQEEKLYKVPMNKPLHKILSSEKVVVRTGTLGIVVLAKNTEFYSKFTGKYSCVFTLPL